MIGTCVVQGLQKESDTTEHMPNITIVVEVNIYECSVPGVALSPSHTCHLTESM